MLVIWLVMVTGCMPTFRELTGPASRHVAENASGIAAQELILIVSSDRLTISIARAYTAPAIGHTCPPTADCAIQVVAITSGESELVRSCERPVQSPSGHHFFGSRPPPLRPCQ